MSVPLLDLTRQYGPLREQMRVELDRVCDSQRFILGPDVDEFELAAAKALGVPYALGVSSGTDALLIALMALGVGEGDEVILPTFSFFATAGVVVRVGAKPVFVDVDAVDYCIDPEKLKEKISSRTKAIIPVHLFGQAANMDKIRAAAGDVPLIEDCAQAWGADFAGKSVGSMGRMGAFSFFPSKNIGCFGDGGLVTCCDQELFGLLKQLRVHGQSGVYEHAYVGGNFRIDALQAAVLNVKLPYVNSWIEGRRANAERYAHLFDEAGLLDIITAPVRVEGRGHTFNQYVIRAPRRDELRAFLNLRGIGAAVYYPLALHMQPCFRNLGGAGGQAPVAEKACEEVLALPVFGELRDEELVEVVQTIAEFYQG